MDTLLRLISQSTFWIGWCISGLLHGILYFNWFTIIFSIVFLVIFWYQWRKEDPYSFVPGPRRRRY